ncbi:MAG: Ig-like domain-containing protein, partial [Proteobacteria bacterium]|nr:Ig-like domain-containing protein [Pseudomonadota bacterium]
LAPNTLYTVTIKGGVSGAKDLAGNPLASDFVISWTTSATADTTPPTVTGTIHANGATNVAINTKVGATFSEGMDPLTITNLTFTLEAPVGTPVPGTVSYSGVNAVFTPLSNLAPNTLYTVTIKGGVSGAKDLAGNPLASDYVWSWTTGAAPDIIPPTVSSTNPADLAVGICINKTINATLSEPMDLLTITTATFTLAVTAGASVDGVVAYDALTNIATFDPTLNLTATTNYTATIKGGVSGAKDLAGNPLASDFVWTFTTGTTDCQTSVPLGAASTFAILAEAAITINPPSAVTGDVGTNPAAGSLITGSGICDPGTVTGTIYAMDATGPACAGNVGPVPNIISAAQTAALAAYLDAVAAPRGTPVAITTDLEGLTFYPGLYESGTSIDLSKTSAVGGKLYLDAQGDVNAVFIIRSATTIITISGTEVVLTNGAQAKNVFWVAGSAVTLGTTSIMKGTLIASTALTLNIGSNLEGRALNQGAAATAITCDQCTITVPSP